MTDNENTTPSETLVVEDGTSLEDTHVVTEQNNDDSTIEPLEGETEEESTSDEEDDSQLESQRDSSANHPEGDEDEEDSEADNEVLAAMKKLRNEAKNLRTRLKDAEKELTELKASKSDEALTQERDDYKSKYDTLVAQHRTEKVTRLVTDTAREQGAIEPDAIAKLVDQSKIEWSEEGEPTNVKDVVSTLKTTYKRLFTGVHGSGNIGNRNERGSENEGLTPQQLMASSFKKNND